MSLLLNKPSLNHYFAKKKYGINLIPLENRCIKIRLCNVTNRDWNFLEMKERDSVYVKSGFIREGEHLYVVRNVMCSHVMACNGGEFCSRIPIFADLFANLSKRKRKSFWNSVPLLPRHKLIWAFENHRSRVFQQKIYFGNGLTFLSSQVWFENKSFSFLKRK